MKLSRQNLKLVQGLMLVACVFLVWRASRSKPTYKGRTTEQWLQVLYEPLVFPSDDPGVPGISGESAMRVLARRFSQEAFDQRAQAEAALRIMGTTALPTLLEKLQARDSALVLKVATLSGRLGDFSRQHVLHAECDHQQALRGFATLGTVAKPAIPDLVKLLDQPKVAERAYEALAQFDDNPVPWLLQVATNASTPPKVRANAMFALGNRQYVDAGILAVLLAGVRDADAKVRLSAANSLSRFPEHALARTIQFETNRMIPPRVPIPLMRRPDATTGAPAINPMTGLPIVNPQ